MSAKKRIRIVNKTKFITAVTLLVLFIVMFVFLVSSLTGDKIEKQIEKLEDGKVTVLDRRFESSVKDESIVEIGQTVTFRLVYYYQTETREIRSFDVTEDITITLADETKDTPSSVEELTKQKKLRLSLDKELEKLKLEKTERQRIFQNGFKQKLKEKQKKKMH